MMNRYHADDSDPAPLDNDALTRLVYSHDDEIVQLLNYIRRLEGQVRELEKKIENRE